MRDFRWNSFVRAPVSRIIFPHNHAAELRAGLAESLESSAQRKTSGALTCWISGGRLRNSGPEEKTARGNYGNLLKTTLNRTAHRTVQTLRRRKFLIEFGFGQKLEKFFKIFLPKTVLVSF